MTLPIKIDRFFGMVPRVSDELLSDQPLFAASFAVNTRYDTGQLVPYRQPSPVGKTNRVGEVNTILGVVARDGQETFRLWFSWSAYTDVVIGVNNDTRFRFNGQFFYYTDGDMPKMTYGDIALGMNPPDLDTTYPVAPGAAVQPRRGFYRLGLPKPRTRPTVTVEEYQTRVTASFSRDSSGFVTIQTTTAHGLRTGNVVTISGFGDRPIDDPIVVPPGTGPGPGVPPPMDPDPPEQPN